MTASQLPMPEANGREEEQPEAAVRGASAKRLRTLQSEATESNVRARLRRSRRALPSVDDDDLAVGLALHLGLGVVAEEAAEEPVAGRRRSRSSWRPCRAAASTISLPGIAERPHVTCLHARGVDALLGVVDDRPRAGRRLRRPGRAASARRRRESRGSCSARRDRPASYSTTTTTTRAAGAVHGLDRRVERALGSRPCRRSRPRSCIACIAVRRHRDDRR